MGDEELHCSSMAYADHPDVCISQASPPSSRSWQASE